jgi:hypothetical protein
MQYTELVDAAGDNPDNMRRVASWLPTISQRIEEYLNRRLHIEQYTEYWDSREDMIEYLVLGAPIIQINSVCASSMGLYTGEEYLIINYYISRFGSAISLNYPVTRWRKGLRAIYTGGYAYHGTQSTFAIGTVTGTWSVGSYVSTNSQSAMGKVSGFSAAGNYMIIDNLWGIFNVGDSLVEQDTLYTAGTSDGTAIITASSEKDYTQINFAINNVAGIWAAGKYCAGLTSGCVGIITAVGATYITVTYYYYGSAQTPFIVGESIRQQDDYLNVGTSTGAAVITAKVQRSIAEAYPEIAAAAEMELRYMVKHQFDFENQGTYKEQTSRRPDKWSYQLQPESIALLQAHRRYLL